MTKFINHIKLLLGFTLVNKHGHLVKSINGKQVWSNHKRKRPYSLDDPNWKILW